MEEEQKSYMQLIKEWIEKCPLLNNGKINVDYLKDDINNYSIDKTPVNPILKTYSDGGTLRQITLDFSVQAPLSSQSIVNLTNSKFCEDFMDWIEEQNKINKLPKIPGITQIMCTSSGYVLHKTETTAIYVIQLNCQYYKDFN